MKLMPPSCHPMTIRTTVSVYGPGPNQDENTAPPSWFTLKAPSKGNIRTNSFSKVQKGNMLRRTMGGKRAGSNCCALAYAKKMSVHELKALSRKIDLSTTPLNKRGITPKDAAGLLLRSHRADTNGTKDDIVTLSHMLRINLSLAKFKLMDSLSRSPAPKDIQVYECLKKDTPDDMGMDGPDAIRYLSMRRMGALNGTDMLKWRTLAMENKDDILSSSFAHHDLSALCMSPSSDDHLLALPNGFGSKDTPYTTCGWETPLFPLVSAIAGHDTDSLPVASDAHQGQAFVAPWLSSDTVSNDTMTSSATIESDYVADLTLHTTHEDILSTPHDFSASDFNQAVTEAEIDSWLQRGGGDHCHIAMATDQELADLLNFDVLH